MGRQRIIPLDAVAKEQDEILDFLAHRTKSGTDLETLCYALAAALSVVSDLTEETKLEWVH